MIGIFHTLEIKKLYQDHGLKQVKKDIRRKAVEKVEKNFLLNALIKNDWNVTHAAGKTGLQRTNFQSLMKKHGIRLPNK